MLNHNTKFFAPVDTEDAPAGKELNTSTAILDILNESDDTTDEGDEIDLTERKTKEPKKDVTEEDDSKEKTDDETTDDKSEEDESDELTEIEDELDEDNLDEDDELELVNMPRRAEILKKYPDVFKDFPGLEKAFYRDRKFTELFVTPKDAESAVEKSKILDGFEAKLLNGDTIDIIKAVKAENENSFNQLVDNYLPTLKQVDEKAYFHVCGTIVKGIIYNMVKEGRDNEDEDIQKAADVLNQFVFNTRKYTPPTKLAKSDNSNTENPEAAKLAKEREEFTQQKFESARDTLDTRVHNTLTKAIEKYIDPKESMTPYVRKNASREAHEELSKLMGKDVRLKTILDKAWKAAYEAGFNDESMGRIKKVIINRAQSLLPSVIKKARNEALRGMGKRIRNDDTDETETDTTQGKSTSSSNRGPLKEKSRSNEKSKNSVPQGISSRDFLMSD